jgi:DNA-binding transcriptional activator of the SARP family
MNAAPLARVVLLGGFAVELAGAEPGSTQDDLPSGVQRLVAYLGLADRPTRAAIAGHLWPDVPQERAHGSLRSALWRLHKVAPGLVESSGGALVLARGVRVDVREFTQWARRVLDPRTDVAGIASAELGLPGELLPGWYDEWVLLERERLCQLRMHALEAWAGKLAAAGRYGEAIQAACAAVGVEPLRESAHRTLVRIHLAQGNVAEAVRSYESFRALLAADLGVEPTAQMDTLVSRVRRSPAAHLITTR